MKIDRKKEREERGKTEKEIRKLLSGMKFDPRSFAAKSIFLVLIKFFSQGAPLLGR